MVTEAARQTAVDAANKPEAHRFFSSVPPDRLSTFIDLRKYVEFSQPVMPSRQPHGNGLRHPFALSVGF
jgi:hypothetical protein